MRADVVVLPAVIIEPFLGVVERCASLVQGLQQASVEALYLALGLGVTNTAPVQTDALLHEPERQTSAACGSLGTAPWNPMIHEHAFGKATIGEGLFQLVAHRCGVRAACGSQRNQVTAVIIDDRQRTDWPPPATGPLEVHLPELVRPFALEALERLRMTVAIGYKIVAQQDAVHRSRWQLNALASEQDGQFTGAPIWITLTQPDHLCLDGISGPPRAGARPAASLSNTTNTRGAIAVQP